MHQKRAQKWKVVRHPEGGLIIKYEGIPLGSPLSPEEAEAYFQQKPDPTVREALDALVEIAYALGITNPQQVVIGHVLAEARSRGGELAARAAWAEQRLPNTMVLPKEDLAREKKQPKS
jgi:hypothetical protein